MTVPSTSSLGKSGWVVVGTLMLATMLPNLASVCLLPQIVVLAEEFGRPVNEVVWATAAFHVVATGMGGVAAALGATLGNRRMLTITLGLLLAGSLIAALSTNLSLLVAGRVIQGAAMAVQALAIGIIANYWRGEPMRQAMSMIVLAMGLGAVVAYLLSGLIWKTGGDWRTLFWILVGATAIDLLLTLAFIKETRRIKEARADYVGCVGLVTWAVLLLLPLSQANSWGWGSIKLLGLLLPGIAVLILWVLWELRCPSPLVNLRVLKRMGVWQGGVAWLVIAIGLVIPATSMPYLLQTPVASGFGFGKSMFVVSLALGIPASAMCVASAAAPLIMRMLTAKGTMLLGVLFGLTGFGLAFAHGSFWLVMLWIMFTGISAALAGSASYSVAAEAVSPEQGVVVSTIYNTAAGLGSAVGSAMTGYILSIRQVAVEVTAPSGPEMQLFPANETYTWAALTVAGMAIIGILVVLSIRSKQLRSISRA